MVFPVKRFSPVFLPLLITCPLRRIVLVQQFMHHGPWSKVRPLSEFFGIIRKTPGQLGQKGQNCRKTVSFVPFVPIVPLSGEDFIILSSLQGGFKLFFGKAEHLMPFQLSNCLTAVCLRRQTHNRQKREVRGTECCLVATHKLIYSSLRNILITTE